MAPMGMNEWAPGQALDERPPEAFRGDTSAKVWTVLFGITLAIVAAGWIATMVIGLQVAINPDGDMAQRLERNAQSLTAADLWSETLFSFFFIAVAPLVWIVMTRVQPRLGTLRYLDVRDVGMSLLRGVGVGLGMLLALFVVRIIQLAITGELSDLLADNSTAEPSPLIEAFARTMTWPLALAISLVAAIGEEILFRGILQKWIGWIGSAVVFGLAHAGYGTWEQIVFPFAIGLGFGYAYKRGVGIVVLMAAHFTFDFVQLSLLLVGS